MMVEEDEEGDEGEGMLGEDEEGDDDDMIELDEEQLA